MPRYFFIAQGLRGCYLLDSGYVIKCDTRRELKSALEYEARDIRDAGFIGANKRAIASLATELWRRKDKSGLDSVIPLRFAHQDSWPYGLFGSPATRDDYTQFCEEN